MAERTLRVCALYPDLMNIYADRGNLLLLQRRCEWRGLGFSLEGAGLGDELDPDAHDLFYLGGGQDRDQALCAQDLATVKRDALHAAAGRGAVLFAVCGGYQLLGEAYVMGGERLPGIGLVDLETVREDGPRLIGNVAIEVDLAPWPAAGSRPGPGGPARSRILAGFENHGGRTRLGSSERPLGRVLRGHGNDGRSGFEGVRGGAHGTVVGTYLHGPLLPKNAWFADWLTATALGLAPEALGPLDDALEDAAHAGARRARRGLSAAPPRRPSRIRRHQAVASAALPPGPNATHEDHATAPGAARPRRPGPPQRRLRLRRRRRVQVHARAGGQAADHARRGERRHRDEDRLQGLHRAARARARSSPRGSPPPATRSAPSSA